MLQRIAGGYLVGVSVAVAAYFAFNPVYAWFFDPTGVWFVLDILMVAAAVPALWFNIRRKLADGGDWSVNMRFYATLAVTLLLLHNWFSFLLYGLDPGDHSILVVWAAVDVALPLVFGATGVAMIRESGEEG